MSPINLVSIAVVLILLGLIQFRRRDPISRSLIILSSIWVTTLTLIVTAFRTRFDEYQRYLDEIPHSDIIGFIANFSFSYEPIYALVSALLKGFNLNVITLYIITYAAIILLFRKTLSILSFSLEQKSIFFLVFFLSAFFAAFFEPIRLGLAIAFFTLSIASIKRARESILWLAMGLLTNYSIILVLPVYILYSVFLYYSKRYGFDIRTQKIVMVFAFCITIATAFLVQVLAQGIVGDLLILDSLTRYSSLPENEAYLSELSLISLRTLLHAIIVLYSFRLINGNTHPAITAMFFFYSLTLPIQIGLSFNALFALRLSSPFASLMPLMLAYIYGIHNRSTLFFLDLNKTFVLLIIFALSMNRLLEDSTFKLYPIFQ
jgi:hypothetical protein